MWKIPSIPRKLTKEKQSMSSWHKVNAKGVTTKENIVVMVISAAPFPSNSPKKT